MGHTNLFWIIESFSTESILKLRELIRSRPASHNPETDLEISGLSVGEYCGSLETAVC